MGFAVEHAGVERESLSLLYDYKVKKNISEDYESRRDSGDFHYSRPHEDDD